MAFASYRVDPSLCYLVAIFFPGFMVFPSSIILPLAGALTMLRVGIFIAALAAFREFGRKLAQGGFVLVLSDLLVPAMSIWMIVTILMHQGTAGLVGYGTVSALEFWFAYLVGRMFFGTPAGFAQFIRVFKVAAAAILVSALLDTASGLNIVSKVGAMLTRSTMADAGAYQAYRFGLIRAQGSLEHPILLGVFGATALVLFFHSRMSDTQKGIWCGLSALMALSALSSAAFLSLAIFGVAVAFGHIFRDHPWKWRALAMLGAFCLLLLVLLVDNPVEALIKNLTLDPQTGLFRIQIWQWVGVNVRHSPWIGIGFADWIRPENMPSSIDSLWLIQSIRHGLPALVLLVAAILTTGIALPLRARKNPGHPFIPISQSGLGIAICIYAFNAFTVHFWGTNWTLLAAILGIRAGFTEALYLTPLARADDQIDEADDVSLFRRSIRRVAPKGRKIRSSGRSRGRSAAAVRGPSDA